MAQDLFKDIRFLRQGDFSQEDIIVDNVITGKSLPTSESIFTSDKDQIIFLELWNENESGINVFVKLENKVIQNNIIGVCHEEKYAHTLHQIEIKRDEQLFASSDEADSISYNIIL